MNRVCVFCGSSPGARPEYIQAAESLGRALARRNIALVYGGAKVGMMGRVAQAALAEGGDVVGVIPQELYESADIDGATWSQKLRKVTIPLLWPTITVSLFISITNSFRVFELPFALTRGSPMRMTETLSFNIYAEGFSYWNNGLASAKAIVLLVIVAAIGLLQVRITSRKEVVA